MYVEEVEVQIPLGVGLWRRLVESPGRAPGSSPIWALPGHLGVLDVETPLRQLAEGSHGRTNDCKGPGR